MPGGHADDDVTTWRREAVVASYVEKEGRGWGQYKAFWNILLEIYFVNTECLDMFSIFMGYGEIKA